MGLYVIIKFKKKRTLDRDSVLQVLFYAVLCNIQQFNEVKCEWSEMYNDSSQLGMILPVRNIWQCLEILLLAKEDRTPGFWWVEARDDTKYPQGAGQPFAARITLSSATSAAAEEAQTKGYCVLNQQFSHRKSSSQLLLSVPCIEQAWGSWSNKWVHFHVYNCRNLLQLTHNSPN